MDPHPPAADPAELSAVAALVAMACGELSSAAYAEALLARAERWRDLNAFTALDPPRLRAAAAAADARRGAGGLLPALLGLPLAIKDNIDVAGWVTTAGTPALRAHRPARSAGIVARLEAAGALVLGKNTLHELAHGTTCENAAWGPVRNPYDRTRIPGGSSGGTAAAVAARIAPAGVGTDTGGSVRIPAALCGIAGFRPSTHRYPQDGIVPISHTRDTAGFLARTVADLALLDGVVCGGARALGAASLAGLKLGVPRGLFYHGLDPALAALTETALARLTAAGAVLVEADVAGLEGRVGRVAGVISDYEFPRDLAAYLAASGSGITLEAVIAELAGADLRQTFAHEVRGPRAPSASDYRHALEVGRPAIQAAFAAHFAAHAIEAVVFPTTAQPARPIGAGPEIEIGGKRVKAFAADLRNPRPATVAGLPALSLPIGLTAQGLPVALELDGPAGTDRRLLAIGGALEALFGPLPPPRHG
jgi:Asp-tRNA(Asn)/Glu-tRNA(Gln) amidotransferase A subunit family amidase